MREYPWHLRKALLKHHRWFRNLTEFHGITRAWIQERKLDPSTNPHLTEDIKLLETMADPRLDTLLDDSAPDDFLGRLEGSVRAVQAWTHQEILSGVKPSERETVSSSLEHATWKQGQASAERRWGRLADVQRSDLRAVFLTLIDSPIALSLGEDAFLLKRGLAQDLVFEFRACPHAIPFSEALHASTELCGLHSAWIRGYLYGLNPKTQMDYHPQLAQTTPAAPFQRCSQHWRLVE